MKKLSSIILALAVLAGCSSDRSQILKVYNWSCYIDEALIGEFEQWYEDRTGESVKVIYQTFDVNETMLSKIELGKEDYDVVCPSDYIIERMLASDLLLPLQCDFPDSIDYLGGIAPAIKSYFDQIDGHGRNANDYSVAYMWGTNGLLYNADKVSADSFKDWSVLQNPDYAGKILMKDAFRDVYTSVLVGMEHDAIAAGEKTVAEVCFDSSDESIAKVEEFLCSFRDGIAGYEADFGKEQMTKELAWLSFNWSGDAQWAIEEAALVGVNLDYAIPECGSTIWFDGWVIPKYAQNVKAASYWIDFMCKPENAIRNMDEIGYVSAVGGPEVLAAMIDEDAYEPLDAGWFFGEGAEAVCVSPVQYPDASIVPNLGMLHDSGDRTEALLQMWSRVKGDSASNMTVIVIAVTLVAVVAAVVIARGAKSRRKTSRRRR